MHSACPVQQRFASHSSRIREREAHSSHMAGRTLAAPLPGQPFFCLTGLGLEYCAIMAANASPGGAWPYGVAGADSAAVILRLLPSLLDERSQPLLEAHRRHPRGPRRRWHHAPPPAPLGLSAAQQLGTSHRKTPLHRQQRYDEHQ